MAKKDSGYRIEINKVKKWFQLLTPTGHSVMRSPYYSTTRSCVRAAQRTSEKLGIHIKD